MSNIWIPETYRERPYQKARFADLVEWAHKNHPFYQKHLPNPELDVPILSRDDFTDDNELLLNGHEETGRTSGSTGIPVRVAWPPVKNDNERVSNTLFRQWVGPKLPTIMLVSQREAANHHNAFDICRPVQDQVEFMTAKSANLEAFSLVTYPSNALQIARFVIDNKLSFPKVERLVSYAESYDEDITPVLEAAFPNADIWNNYSCSEVGIMALKCPHEPDFLHVMGHNVGLEVLNDEDRPCSEGERGRIVVTDWHNNWSPFIRYDIGDMAIPGNCPCGKISSPALRKVLGKVRGFLKDEQGNARIFANIGAELKHVEGLRQYQIIQNEIGSLRVRYAITDEKDDERVKKRLETEIWHFLGFEPVLHFEKESRIERSENGKFYTTVCNI